MKFPDKATICTSLKNEDVVIHYTFFPNHFFGFFSVVVQYTICNITTKCIFSCRRKCTLYEQHMCVCAHICSIYDMIAKSI